VLNAEQSAASTGTKCQPRSNPCIPLSASVEQEAIPERCEVRTVGTSGDAGPARETSKDTGAGGAKPVNPRGDLGARANYLAAKNAGEGVTRSQAVQGVTFDAGPTRTWVRGRSTGQLGRRPLSRFGALRDLSPQSRVRRFADGPIRAGRRR